MVVQGVPFVSVRYVKLLPAPKATDWVPENAQVLFSGTQKVYPSGPVGVDEGVVEEGVVPVVFDTVIEIPDDVPILPDASDALVVSVWVPFERDVVVREKVYGALRSVPMSVPSA